jgi:hypothetical protein
MLKYPSFSFDEIQDELNEWFKDQQNESKLKSVINNEEPEEVHEEAEEEDKRQKKFYYLLPICPIQP